MQYAPIHGYTHEKKYNKAYIAHIVADSLDGPRGDPERSEKLANEISNLMLLCDPHHTLIDKDVANHPEDRLVEMKRKHEERIARITAIAPEKSRRSSFTVRISGNTLHR